MLTLERVLGLYWLVMLVVQEMKKHFSNALPALLESLALTMMMLVLNVLVSITLTLKLYTYFVQVNIDVLFYSSLSSGDVRLAGSSDPLRGRVEVCVNETWGTICEDFWDMNDTSVVCRQLGFSATGIYQL